MRGYLVALVAVVALAACSNGDPDSVKVVNCSDATEVTTVAGTPNGFTPPSVAVHPGDVVKFAMAGTQAVLTMKTSSARMPEIRVAISQTARPAAAAPVAPKPQQPAAAVVNPAPRVQAKQ